MSEILTGRHPQLRQFGAVLADSLIIAAATAGAARSLQSEGWRAGVLLLALATAGVLVRILLRARENGRSRNHFA